MSNLAAIIEEGENAERAYREAKAFSSAEIGAGDWCHRFYVAHGPALLAVAKAAMEMRKAQGAYFGVHSIEHDPGYTASVLADTTAAFDAAVRGDAGGEG